MSHRRFARAAALGLALVALQAQTAAAGPVDLRSAARTSSLSGTTSPSVRQDLRSPDTRDAALATQARQDLRSPDTRDAALATQPPQDLRSPDTRDAAGRGSLDTPEATILTTPEPSPMRAPTSDRGDADAGAARVIVASVLALVLLGLASTIAVVSRRHGARRQIRTAG